MPILDPADANRLLAIASLKKFVEDEKQKYVKRLGEWKKTIGNNADLNSPYMLAGMLAAHMKMYDAKLASLMRDIWKDDLKTSDEYYTLVAKYFVDAAP